MKVTFNSLGQIVGGIDYEDQVIRQGSTEIVLKAVFQDKLNINYNAKFNLTRSDGTNITNVTMNLGTDSNSYIFALNDEWYFAKSGQATLTVFLVDGNGTQIATGQVQFNVQANDYDEEPETITEEQYNSLLALISKKVGFKTKTVRVTELPEVGEEDTIYFLGYSDRKLVEAYIYSAENGEYQYLGSNSIDLGNYYERADGEEFEREIYSRVTNVENELSSVASGSPKGVYATVAALTSADPDHDYIYVVTQDGHWYYWNSNNASWADGGTYLSNLEQVDDFFSVRSSNAVKNKVIAASLQKNGWVSPKLIDGNGTYEIVKELLKSETTFTDGYYLQDNGAVSNSLACYTDYLQVYAGQKLYVEKGCGFPAAGEYYNESKVYQYNVVMNVGSDTTGDYIRRSGQVWIVPANGYVRINIKIGAKSIASVKSILKTREKKVLEWLKVNAANIDGNVYNEQKNISNTDGTPIVSFIRNHMWLKNGTLYTSNAEYGSTQTIPLNKATSITVLPLYLYGQEENIGNGAFVDSLGNFISNIDENAVWDNDHITFTAPVPSNAYGVQLNAVLLPASQGEKYTNSTESSANNPSSTLYVILNNTTKVLNWLTLKDGIIEPNNFNLGEIWQINRISEDDGTPIVPFIRNHMWLKDGSIYSANTNWGSTQTIVLNGISSFRMMPYYKYNKEQNVDNGAFVDENGNWVASLMVNATWDETQTYLIVEVPSNAYGVQLNATFTNNDKYDITFSSNTNASSTLYYSTQYSIKVPWLKVSGGIDWSDIPNNVITYASLTSDVKSRLALPYEESYKYWDSLNKPFDFQGHTLVAFGDSITAGVANEGSENYSAGANSFINLFASKFSMTFYNRAVSGSCITSGVNELTPICDKVDEYTFLNTANEFVFIIGGTNDFNSDAPLGQLGDTAKTTFYGALDHICQRLQLVASNSTIVFITPINVNTNYFPRKASGSTLTLNKYRNAIWEVATKYGFNVVDGSTIGFAKEINTTWGNLMIAPSDGTHPTLAGHALYFRGLCDKLK